MKSIKAYAFLHGTNDGGALVLGSVRRSPKQSAQIHERSSNASVTITTGKLMSDENHVAYLRFDPYTPITLGTKITLQLQDVLFLKYKTKTDAK
jgi:hypothetical protein